ncbi:MAG: hypothetical protein ACI9YH_002955 [Colwellia sp.]|jgi:hypothetical protein
MMLTLLHSNIVFIIQISQTLYFTIIGKKIVKQLYY